MKIVVIYDVVDVEFPISQERRKGSYGVIKEVVTRRPPIL